MAWQPEVPPDEVARRLAAGGLSYLQVYELTHQHPLNKACHLLGIPAISASLWWVPVAWLGWGVLSWQVPLALFVGGWAFQFLGHAIEGNKPTFFGNPLYMLVGPLHFFFVGPLKALRGGPSAEAPAETSL